MEDHKSKSEKDMTLKYKYAELFPDLLKRKSTDKQETHMLKNITICFNLAVPYVEIENSRTYFVDYSNSMNKLIKYLTDNFEEYQKLYQKKNLQEHKELSNEDGSLNTSGKTIKSIFTELEKTNRLFKDNIPAILAKTPGKYVYTLFRLSE